MHTQASATIPLDRPADLVPIEIPSTQLLFLGKATSTFGSLRRRLPVRWILLDYAPHRIRSKDCRGTLRGEDHPRYQPVP